nr:endonuclease/exonuclease/phosphatase family protein [Wenxinia marina]
MAEVRPDLLLLTDIDFDAGHAAITALQGALAERGVDLPHAFALPPNSGVPTGRDLDGNGRLGEARDAQGYGRFAGDGGLALLSRWPFATGARDFTSLLWADLPGATLPGGEANADIQRLSSTAHWQVPLTLPDGPATILAWSATPPVFDGPEDRNGLRGADEARLWTVLMDGGLGPPPEGRLIVMGNANLDPADGDGRREAIAAVLAHPRLQDPRPASAGGAAAADADHAGDPALDTADWRPPVGNLRVAYLLPSAGWPVEGAGVFWPAPDDPQAALLGEDGLAAGPHRLAWVDLALD